MPERSFESDDEPEIARVKRELRARGWYVRYTEWPSGHQVVLHLRAEPAVHVVTGWCSSELAAWREALATVERGAPGRSGSAPTRASRELGAGGVVVGDGR